jgi:DNA-binding MarR family transcriptional regulator
MTTDPQQIRDYLRETLGVSVRLASWPSSRLPLFLREGYAFSKAEIFGQLFLLMVDRGTGDSSPVTIRKHMDQVRGKWDGEIIYVRDQVAAYQRKRLIEQKVQFVVPGNQMYLPMLGIDLREHFRTLRETPPAFSPATQAFVLHALLRGRKDDVYTPGEVAERLGYTKMTMSRTFDELEGDHIAEVSKRGRERCLTFGKARRELWEKTLPLMRSPVKQRRHIHWQGDRRPGVVAGLSALARDTMLAAPRNDVVAMSSKDWSRVPRHTADAKIAADDPEAIEVEIWSYNPKLLAEEDVVDRFSLFLSLRDSEDERVEQALEQLMEAAEW